MSIIQQLYAFLKNKNKMLFLSIFNFFVLVSKD